MTTVLMLHGLTGLGRQHWQGWLAHALAEEGVAVEVPVFSDPDQPSLPVWLEELDHHLAAAQPEVVVAHSLGAALWLHHAARAVEGRTWRVSRVLLVSPPGPEWTHPDVHGFVPAPLDPAGIRRASARTLLVTGEADPCCPVAEAVAMAAELKIDLDVIHDGGGLDAVTGYGPWPDALAWVHDRTVRLGANSL